MHLQSTAAKIGFCCHCVADTRNCVEYIQAVIKMDLVKKVGGHWYSSLLLLGHTAK